MASAGVRMNSLGVPAYYVFEYGEDFGYQDGLMARLPRTIRHDAARARQSLMLTNCNGILYSPDFNNEITA